MRRYLRLSAWKTNSQGKKLLLTDLSTGNQLLNGKKLLRSHSPFFTTLGDVVRCAFCQVEGGHWIEWDDAFKEHKRWSPSCGFVNGVFVWNIPAPSKTPQQQPSNSYEVCGPYTEYIPKTTRSERGKYIYLRLFTFIYFLLCIIISVN
jgi:hypothetical protein